MTTGYSVGHNAIWLTATDHDVRRPGADWPLLRSTADPLAARTAFNRRLHATLSNKLASVLVTRCEIGSRPRTRVDWIEHRTPEGEVPVPEKR